MNFQCPNIVIIATKHAWRKERFKCTNKHCGNTLMLKEAVHTLDHLQLHRRDPSDPMPDKFKRGLGVMKSNSLPLEYKYG